MSQGEHNVRCIVRFSCKHIACLVWCSFAIHEPPKHQAEQFNPDIHETFWLGLGTDADPQHIANECRWMNLGRFPPLEGFSPIVCCHSLVDPTYAPPGRHVAQNEMQSPPASAHTEKQWLELKKRYIEDMMTVWQKYAPNMTSDNLIGIDSNSPYDNLRMKNLAPHGNAERLDRSVFQLGENRPLPELANHRTPVKNLYTTGTAWHPGGAMAGLARRTTATRSSLLTWSWTIPGRNSPVTKRTLSSPKSRRSSRGRRIP